MPSLRLFLLIAVLALCGCTTSPKLPPPSTPPPLDQSLANDCAQIGPVPVEDNDFDVLLDWIRKRLLVIYGDCAIRHRQTVDAWPK